ncbi:MAG: GGDEF domain-containing protein [Candidatus Kuenenia sp.]|nr:GGDEF domain-containing protein [Candidatus Kuenenia hertensis]
MLTRDIINDELTGAYNKRFMYDMLEKLIDLEKNNNGQLGIVIAELLDLKNINVLYGHNAGNEILQQTATLLQRYTRPSDILARYDNDAFGIIMPHTNTATVIEQAEMLGKLINKNAFINHSIKKRIPIKTSIGISIFPDHATETYPLIEAAKKALCQAKNKGANSIVLFNKETDSSNNASF